MQVLLQELEKYTGVVIFATNLDREFRFGIRETYPNARPLRAARGNGTPANLEGAVDPSLAPLAADVDFDVLARHCEVRGGDIEDAGPNAYAPSALVQYLGA